MKKAFFYFNQNISFYKKTGMEKMLGETYLSISFLFDTKTDAYKQAIAYNSLALQLFESINEYEGVADVYLNMSAIYGSLATPNLDSVSFYLQLGLKLTKEKKIIELEPYFLGNLSRMYLENGQTEKARLLAKNTYKIFKYKLKDKSSEFVVLKVLFNISMLTKDYKAAKKQLMERKKIAKKLNYLVFFKYLNEDYIQFYEEQKQIDSAHFYLKKLTVINDSIHKLNIEKELQEISEKYQNEKKEARIVLLIQQQAGERNYRYFLISSLLLTIAIFLFAYYFLYKRKQKSEQRIIELNLSEELRKAKIENIEAENIVRIEKNKYLKKELEFKNKELNLLAISSIEKNNEVNETILKLKEITSQDKNPKLKKIILLLEKNVSTDKDWRFFKIHFERTFPDFIQKIKDEHPNLSFKDIQLITYIKTNLKNSEIATIFGISTKSIEVAKFRLKKKMVLSTEDNLNQYIINF